MARCIKCSGDMGDKDGIFICQDCVTTLLKSKTLEELVVLAKVGIDAMVDEATGYQYKRPINDLSERHKGYREKK